MPGPWEDGYNMPETFNDKWAAFERRNSGLSEILGRTSILTTGQAFITAPFGSQQQLHGFGK